MRWGTNEMGGQWDGGPFGLAENAWTNEKGDQWEGGPMSSNNVVGDLWIGGPMRRGPMRWGTNEMGDQWVGGTNEMGDQWNGWCLGANWGTNEMGNQWDGGPMRWGECACAKATDVFFRSSASSPIFLGYITIYTESSLTKTCQIVDKHPRTCHKHFLAAESSIMAG